MWYEKTAFKYVNLQLVKQGVQLCADFSGLCCKGWFELFALYVNVLNINMWKKMHSNVTEWDFAVV